MKEHKCEEMEDSLVEYKNLLESFWIEGKRLEFTVSFSTMDNDDFDDNEQILNHIKINYCPFCGVRL